MSKEASLILWFRRDLRLADNPALFAALAQKIPVIPLFILDEESHGVRPLGGAAKWWLGRSLASLQQSLEKLGAKLILRRGESLEVLRQVIKSSGSRSVFFNRRFDPPGMAIDKKVREALEKEGITIEDFDANYLHEPWQLQTKQGASFKVFTPFWRRLADQYTPPALHNGPRHWPSPKTFPKSDALKSLTYEHAWAKGFAENWQPGEHGAREHLNDFLEEILDGYQRTRDRPDMAGTSRLSPHLAWGEISVHRAWRQADAEKSSGAAAFRRELTWRDFNMHVYYHFPDLPTLAWQEKFRKFPFQKNTAGLHAWQRGLTGYPLVDAGMRELWHTGWMHNRIRMVTASFLIKHQLIDWQKGEEWFWDTLVDADPAQNAGNWQWVAGCGFDAAPFFRIFNPILQGKKFDPKGDYIRHWVPELIKLTNRELNEPWKLSENRLAEHDLTLGKDYPQPVIAHDAARSRALDSYRHLSAKAASRKSATRNKKGG